MTQRVTFISQWYPPEPVRIPEGIAHALRDAGLHVGVLTGVPNYPTGEVPAGYRASQATRETRDGLRVRRAPLFPSHDSRPLGRILNYLSWALSSAFLGQGELRKSDVALVYSSPATAALPAMLARRLWGTPYVLLIQDVWPDSVFASGFLTGRLGRHARRPIEWFVRLSYAWAAQVLVISPGVRTLLEGRGVPASKLTVVYNWSAEEGWASGSDQAASWREDLGISRASRVFMYAGNHGRAQALHTLIHAFSALPAAVDAHLVFVGGGVCKSDLQALAQGHPRIRFLDPVPASEIGSVMREADIQIVSLAPDPLFEITMPSKVQACLSIGQPILAVAPGEAGAVVEAAQAGRAADPDDVASVTSAMFDMACAPDVVLSEMGNSGTRYYARHMSRSVGVQRLTQALHMAKGNFQEDER